MNEPGSVVIIGAGGHARVLAASLKAQGVTIQGFLDPALRGQRFLGVEVLGDDELLETFDPAKLAVVNGIGAKPTRTGPGLETRRAVHERMKQKGFTIRKVVHPSAVVGEEVQIGEGAQIMAGAVIQPNVILGEGAVVNTRVSIDHDCVIGAHAFVGPGATLCGTVVIGEQAFIGAGAVILPEVRIGAFAIVAAGLTVRKSVGERATVLE